MCLTTGATVKGCALAQRFSTWEPPRSPQWDWTYTVCRMTKNIYRTYNFLLHGPGSVAGYSEWLRAGRSEDRIPVRARFSAPIQTAPGAHSASCTLGNGSFSGVKSGRGVTLTPHPFLVPWSWKCRGTPLLSLWAVRPVQSLVACTRVHFTLPLPFNVVFRIYIYIYIYIYMCVCVCVCVCLCVYCGFLCYNS
jgi:hypothetical protein